MAKDSIQLSKKHGLNPAVPKCFYCLENKNEVILAGVMRDDQEAPRNAVWNMEPCDKCKEYMAKGVILISVDAQRTTDLKNPYRTGGWVVVTEAAIRMVTNMPLQEQVLAKRVAFLPDDVWELLGLPKGPIDETVNKEDSADQTQNS